MAPPEKRGQAERIELEGEALSLQEFIDLNAGVVLAMLGALSLLTHGSIALANAASR